MLFYSPREGKGEYFPEQKHKNRRKYDIGASDSKGEWKSFCRIDEVLIQDSDAAALRS